MKVSTKGRYGLRSLVDLAIHIDGNPVSLVSVAKRQNLSLNYLEQVFSILRKADIVKSIKGPKGGYKLSRDANGISVKEVLLVLEGRFSIVDCNYLEENVDPVEMAIQMLVWKRIDKEVNEFLEEYTIGQLVKEYGDRITLLEKR